MIDPITYLNVEMSMSMSNVVEVFASRTNVRQATLPVFTMTLPTAETEDDATRRLVPEPAASVTKSAAVVVALRKQKLCLSPAFGTTLGMVEDAGSVSVAAATRPGVNDTSPVLAHAVNSYAVTVMVLP